MCELTIYLVFENVGQFENRTQTCRDEQFAFVFVYIHQCLTFRDYSTFFLDVLAVAILAKLFCINQYQRRIRSKLRETC